MQSAPWSISDERRGDDTQGHEERQGGASPRSPTGLRPRPSRMRAASQGERVAGQAEGETALGEEETGQHGADTSQGDADADAVPFGVASIVEDAPEVDLGGGLGVACRAD